jgi:2-dehydro-3-deoxyphosphooctonate aldolase (KDO 8-P synthase)
MRGLGVPVAFDATHIIRRPGISSSDPAGGEPEYVPHLTRAAVAAGVDALFIETHPSPRTAACDASSMYPLGRLEALLRQAMALDELVRGWDLGIPDKSEEGFLE